MDHRLDRPATAILIAAVAGCVDAVGCLMLDGLFLSFMSGNAVRLGIALNDRFWGTAGLAAGLVLLFVGGVAAGTLVGARAGRFRAGTLIALAALLLAASAWAGTRTNLPGVPTLVMAMGVLNTVFVGATGPLGVTYVTGALVRIGQTFGGGNDEALSFDLALVTALTAGVVVGAHYFARHGPALLWAPAAALGVAALLHLVASARMRTPRPPLPDLRL